MIVYAIKDATSGVWWSHNHWGNASSIPDLYSTRNRAELQMTKGKCGNGLRWRPNHKPTIVEMNLTEAS
jgi:hypothetical protein